MFCFSYYDVEKQNIIGAIRGHSITSYVDKMRGRGSKRFVFVHTHGIKTVHAGGSENGKILST